MVSRISQWLYVSTRQLWFYLINIIFIKWNIFAFKEINEFIGILVKVYYRWLFHVDSRFFSPLLRTFLLIVLCCLVRPRSLIWASGLKLFLEKEFITPNSVKLIQHRAALPHYNSSLSKRFLAPVALHRKIFPSLFWDIFIGCKVSSFNYPPSSSFASASLSMSRDIFFEECRHSRNARKQLDTEKRWF